jgi:hypothetical protein
MEKSFVGDPVFWPGLVYSPLNSAGLIFALGTVAKANGLLFEEFSEDCRTAVCRRRTLDGWERFRVAFSYRSSGYNGNLGEIDLLVCWIDDLPEIAVPTRMILSRFSDSTGQELSQGSGGIDSILPESATEDLLKRGRSRESYEETVKLLDEQIKKLQNG